MAFSDLRTSARDAFILCEHYILESASSEALLLLRTTSA